MTDKPSDLENAMRELDACMETIKSLMETITSMGAQNAALHEQLIEAMTVNTATPAQSVTVPEKRGRGRPNKVIDDGWMLEWFPKAKAEFIAANKYVEPTDNAVLTWNFEQFFIRLGKSASKARRPAFQRKLKTFRNRLSDARNPLVKRPVK